MDITQFYVYLPILTILGAGGMIWFNNKSDKKSAERKAAHDVQNDNSVKELESIHTETVQVVAKIKDLDKESVDKQKKIKEIVDKATVKINEVKKAKTVAEVDAIADDGWEDL